MTADHILVDSADWGFDYWAPVTPSPVTNKGGVCLRDEEAPAKIEDPDALKPEGWLDDEHEFVSDPSAEKPEDW